WDHDPITGYHYNQSNGCYYDPNFGFYYTDALGKWVTQEGHSLLQLISLLDPYKRNPPSSLHINKRKRPENKSKAVSEEEVAALKAREAARKRVEDREKTFLGLYNYKH
ncbi:zinc finger protein ZOP1, partial [Tanacetum coccineum]